MAQNISLLGATYSDVPAVLLPKATSGMAQFTDVTDTTAAAADVASGKYFYTADGTKTQGTASGGGGDTFEFKGTRDVVFAWRSDYPKKCKITSDFFRNLSFSPSNVQSQLEMNKYIEEVEVDAQTDSTGVTVNGDFRYNGVYALKKINLNFIPLGNIYSFSFVYGANKCPYFEDLLGLNFIYVGGANYRIGSFSNCAALKNITCKPNTLGQLDMVATNRNWWNLSASSLLTDESLCQIANALCATHTSTLTLSASRKAICQSLMGTVSSVTDDTGTYDFFTADANGTVSLADFITQTKGWTLA